MGADALQIHGSFTLDIIQEVLDSIDGKLIVSVDPNAIISNQLDGIVDAVLCDSQREKGAGGTGETNDYETEDFLLINLMSMDNNYHNYFLKYGGDGEDKEFSSLFLGQGGSGRSFGIQGGIGLFGSIGFDRHYLPITR